MVGMVPACDLAPETLGDERGCVLLDAPRDHHSSFLEEASGIREGFEDVLLVGEVAEGFAHHEVCFWQAADFRRVGMQELASPDAVLAGDFPGEFQEFLLALDEDAAPRTEFPCEECEESRSRSHIDHRAAGGHGLPQSFGECVRADAVVHDESLVLDG